MKDLEVKMQDHENIVSEGMKFWVLICSSNLICPVPLHEELNQPYHLMSIDVILVKFQ